MNEAGNLGSIRAVLYLFPFLEAKLTDDSKKCNSLVYARARVRALWWKFYHEDARRGTKPCGGMFMRGGLVDVDFIREGPLRAAKAMRRIFTRRAQGPRRCAKALRWRFYHEDARSHAAEFLWHYNVSCR